MTAMQQIELISVEARKRGMKYGEYVEKFGHTLPKPKTEEIKKPSGNVENQCTICGATFYAGKKGAKFCENCRKERALEYAREHKKSERKKEAGTCSH